MIQKTRYSNNSVQETMKDKDPFFSIVLPTFNRAGFLDRSVNSILQQRFKNWELIIVDDGSTDDTSNIVKEFGDERIRYYHQPNSGISVARNLGIKKSKGTYICFIDDDDEYMENHLSFLYSSIKEKGKPRKLITTNLIICKDGELTEKPHEEYNATDSFNILPYPSSVCIHRCIFKKHLFNENVTRRQDHEFFDRVRRDFGIVTLRKYTVKLHKHGGNVTSNIFKVRKGYEKTTYHYIKTRKKIRFEQLKTLHESYVFLTIYYIRNKNFLKSFTYIVKIVLILPFIFFRKYTVKKYMRILSKIKNKITSSQVC